MLLPYEKKFPHRMGPRLVRGMGEEEGCGNRKSDVASLERKLKLHILVYI